jgi:hypothetical protein
MEVFLQTGLNCAVTSTTSNLSTWWSKLEFSQKNFESIEVSSVERRVINLYSIQAPSILLLLNFQAVKPYQQCDANAALIIRYKLGNV